MSQSNQAETLAKPVQTFFVLVKPDGYENATSIKLMILDAFLNEGEQAKIEFEQTITPGIISQTGTVTRQTIFNHYDKPDKWLTDYGQKIVTARLGIYATKDDWVALQVGKSIPEALADYMMSGHMQAMIFTSTAEKTFEIARTVLGDVDPSKADPESIRGKYSKDSFAKAWIDPNGPRAIHNVCHCSDSLGEAEREIRIFLGYKVLNKFFPKERTSPIYDACCEE
jgi:nucleoside diphosphate kinase